MKAHHCAKRNLHIEVQRGEEGEPGRERGENIDNLNKGGEMRDGRIFKHPARLNNFYKKPRARNRELEVNSKGGSSGERTDAKSSEK